MSTGTGQRGPTVGARRAVPPGDSVLRGRALITGGTSGIGLSFAHALAARGCDLVLVARDAARLDKTAEQLRWRYGVDVETLRADLADRGDVAAVAARLEDADSPVEVLVNNAGRGVHVRLLDPDTTEHESALDLMVRAVLVLGGAAGRAMRARGHGVIINVSSVAGLIPMGMYSAIKSWVRTYSESLALELAGTGVRVTTLLPGWVRTEFHERAGIRASSIPSGLWLEADDVVAECLQDVEKGRLRSVPSKRFAVLAFLAEHGPRPAVRRVTAQLSRSRR
ncbi:SDR family NAD(P)-dependent oxidoreductase [Georgenia thermotolerans]|uniref:SDR family NAD(P)-dependent oxidoreductase n=1 Tax=Georgenia thermotolerans TaxID=527326 RepID=A0A7J5UPL7_9MICO|nr:SDR family NAD(P)-dependent oxidoreductase [Georgenia thermotolerans]KAE8763883.1 SDR family NAD(P)-dependent oxidoreductase [Georgenia thermotolerans]